MKNVYRFKDYLENNSNSNINIDYKDEQSNIINNLKLEFDFIKNETQIEPFYLFSESLINNNPTTLTNNTTTDKDSVVYLTLCALGILFEEPKERYKKLFEELRLRGIYNILKPIVNATKALKSIFSELSNSSGKNVDTFESIFNYTELFTPFMLSISKTIKDNNITPESLEVTEEFKNTILLNMKSLKLNGELKKAVDKINIENDIKYNNDIIKKYSEFEKEVEIITDSISK